MRIRVIAVVVLALVGAAIVRVTTPVAGGSPTVVRGGTATDREAVPAWVERGWTLRLPGRTPHLAGERRDGLET